jgi:hypothetical protein
MQFVVLGEAALGLARSILDSLVTLRDLAADLVPPVGERLGGRGERAAAVLRGEEERLVTPHLCIHGACMIYLITSPQSPSAY